MSLQIYERGGDSWDGRIAPGGRYLLCGGSGAPAPTFAVIDLHATDARRREVLLAPGRSPRWIGPARVTWVVSTGPFTADRWEYDLATQAVHPTADDPALVAGNDLDAAPSGHWASCLVASGRLTLDGRRIGFGFRGVKLAGDLMLSVKDDRYFEIFHQGLLQRTLTKPHAANLWQLSDAGHISYGYWGESRVITPDGVDRLANVTAWRVESPPIFARDEDGAWWAWRHAVRPSDGMPLVLGHPWNDEADTIPGVTPCVIVEGLAAAYLHVVCADGRWIIAGGTNGQIAVHAAPLAAARVAVRDDVAPPSPDPRPPAPSPDEPEDGGEDEMRQPGVTIERYDAQLRSGQRWSMRAADRNNPGVIVETELVPKGEGRWSVHQRFINPRGSDRTVNERIVEVR